MWLLAMVLDSARLDFLVVSNQSIALNNIVI